MKKRIVASLMSLIFVLSTPVLSYANQDFSDINVIVSDTDIAVSTNDIANTLDEKGVDFRTDLEKSIKDVFKQYQKKGIYNMGKTIEINNVKYRLDCSGYVDAVLTQMGIAEQPLNVSSISYLKDKDIRTKLSEKGFKFKKYKANNIKDIAICVRQGNIAFIIKDKSKYQVYCWGRPNATVRTISAKELNKMRFTNMYVLGA